MSRKGSRDVADHMAIQMDDSDSITVSEQSEPSAECWQNMYKLLNFYSLISDPTGILIGKISTWSAVLINAVYLAFHVVCALWVRNHQHRNKRLWVAHGYRDFLHFNSCLHVLTAGEMMGVAPWKQTAAERAADTHRFLREMFCAWTPATAPVAGRSPST